MIIFPLCITGPRAQAVYLLLILKTILSNKIYILFLTNELNHFIQKIALFLKKIYYRLNLKFIRRIRGKKP
jgi:hypothetical protein